MPTSQGISGFGSSISGSVTGTIGQVTGLSIGGISVTDIDITTMESEDGWKEFYAGLKDAGDLSVDVLYENGGSDTILGALGGEVETWTITLPDGATFACEGYLNGNGLEIPMDDKISQALKIKLSGIPEFSSGGSSS